MSEQKTAERFSSRALPTKADDEVWVRMTREEQLAAYRERFTSPACTSFTETTIAQIVERSCRSRKTKTAADGQ
jgi:hypothetical protein